MRRAPYDLGALDDAYDAALGCACDVNGVEDFLPGSASKGATIGAAAGSIIPGVGTVIGGAVGAAAGAVADLFKGIGGKHCEMGGKEVPCPDCGITDIECFKRWVLTKKKEVEAAAAAKARPAGPSALELVRRAQAAAHRPKPPMRPALVRRPPPPPPRVALARVESPMMERAPEHSNAIPIAIGATALAAASGGAWWWWKKRRDA